MNAFASLPHQIGQPPRHPGMPLGRPRPGGILPAAFNLLRARSGMGATPAGASGGAFPGQGGGFGLRRMLPKRIGLTP